MKMQKLRVTRVLNKTIDLCYSEGDAKSNLLVCLVTELIKCNSKVSIENHMLFSFKNEDVIYFKRLHITPLVTYIFRKPIHSNLFIKYLLLVSNIHKVHRQIRFLHNTTVEVQSTPMNETLANAILSSVLNENYTEGILYKPALQTMTK